MKKTNIYLTVGITALALGFQLSSCKDSPTPFIGSWESIAPINATMQMPGSESVFETLSVDFTDSQQKSDGTVRLSGHYDVVRPLTAGTSASGKVSFIAEATVEGIWSHDVDDQDDLLLVYDDSTIDVKIDKNSISGTPAINLSSAQIDSISVVFSSEIKRSFQESLIKYSVMEDVEVSKDDKFMSIEVKQPKQKIKFKRR